MQPTSNNNPSIPIYLFIVMVFLLSCQTQPLDFQITQTEETPLQDMDSIPIDNCDNSFPKSVLHGYFDVNGSVSAENLIANGGEPFVSIRKNIWEMYGSQAQSPFFLTAPAHTNRIFLFDVSNIRYRGHITGPIIDSNKSKPDQEVIYTYLWRKEVFLNGHRDVPC